MLREIDQYFKDYEVRPEFQKEFISLWEGWLGTDDCHKLDEVQESDWQRFNHLVSLIAARYGVLVANLTDHSCHEPAEASELLQTYEEAMQKDSSAFMKLVIPELCCVLTEDWDFTYVLWHKDPTAVTTLAPLISQAGLHHFPQSAA